MARENKDERRDMADLLPLADYQRFEQEHPGFPENIALIIKHLHGLDKKEGSKKMTIIEMGAGPGNPLTKKLSDEFADKGAKVIINEYDQHSVDMLRQLQGLPDDNDNKLSEALTIPDGQSIIDLLKSQADHTVDAIVSNFAMHHLKPSEFEGFFTQAKRVLTPHGKVIAGEEYLAEESKDLNRAALHADYHGRVILEAMQRGEFDAAKLAQLEFTAMVSGLKTVNVMTMSSDRSNDGAVKLLVELKSNIEQISQKDDSYEASKTELVKGIQSLIEALNCSQVQGLDHGVTVYDPYKEEHYDHPPIDYKITFKRYADAARKVGFDSFAVPTGATNQVDAQWQDGDQSITRRIRSTSELATSPGVYVAVSAVKPNTNAVQLF